MEFFKPDSIVYRLAKRWIPVLILILFAWKVLPVALAIFSAYFFYPVIRFLSGTLRLPLWLSALMAEAATVIGVGLMIAFTISQVIQISPEFQRGLEEMNIIHEDPKEILAMIIGKLSLFSERIAEVSTELIQGFSQQLLNFSIFIITFFFSLMETGRSKFWFLIYSPLPFREQIKKVIEQAGSLFGTFISVEFRLFMITFALLSIGFFALGFTMPVGKAFLISLADALPFLGTGLFLMPLSVFYFITGEYFLGTAILLLFLFIQLTRQMAESYLWAHTFHIRSVHAFMISACSLYLFGIVGILLSPFLLLAALKLKQHKLFTSQ